MERQAGVAEDEDFSSETMTSAKKGAVANRRPAGQSDGSSEFARGFCRRRSSPAAVAELSRYLRSCLIKSCLCRLAAENDRFRAWPYHNRLVLIAAAAVACPFFDQIWSTVNYCGFFRGVGPR